MSVPEARERARSVRPHATDKGASFHIFDDGLGIRPASDLEAALARDVLALADENERLQASPMYGPEGRWKELREERDRAMAEAATLRQALEQTPHLVGVIRRALEDHAPPRDGKPGCTYCQGALAAVDQIERAALVSVAGKAT